MSVEYRVNGPAILYVSTGNGGNPEQLAVTESGVRIGYRRFRLPIHDDRSGPRMPAEFQDAGQIAMVSGKMVVIDPEVLDKLRAIGDSAEVGKLNSVGALLGTGGYTVELWIDATNDRPHHFFTTILWENEDELVGTRRTEDDISFYSWAFLQPDATSSLNKDLWDYTRPPGIT